MADVGTEATWAARLQRADDYMAGQYTKLQAFSRRGFREAMGTGLRRGISGAARDLRMALPFDYFRAAAGHYVSMRATGPTFARMGGRIGLRAPGGIGPPAPIISESGMALAGRWMGSVGNVLMKGIGPAAVLFMASQSPHGMGIGIAENVAGFAAWGFGSQVGLAAGGWLGGAAVRGASRTPYVSALLGDTALAAGAGSVGGIAWLIGGLVAFEAAAWSVGFALHTLPTFAKQFQKDMARSGFGGDYVDSAGAATMRQRSLQVMGKSFANARSALGQEASLLHA